MINPNIRASFITALLLGSGMLAGCGGTKVLKEPQPFQPTQALAAASDQRVTATLDWVIVRDGPGTWARNADWDEYLLRVSNHTDTPIQVAGLIVTDSLDTRIEPQPARKLLVKASKQTARRYKKSGVKVKAGSGAGALIVGGAAVTLVGAGAAGAVALGASYGATVGSGAVAAGGLLLLGPALAVGGVMRGLNNSAVSDVIEDRQTVLPLAIDANAERNLDVFFPLAPSPRMVELTYTDADGEHRLIIDTSATLDGLHIDTDGDANTPDNSE